MFAKLREPVIRLTHFFDAIAAAFGLFSLIMGGRWLRKQQQCCKRKFIFGHLFYGASSSK